MIAPLELLYRTIHVKDDIYYFLVGRHVVRRCCAVDVQFSALGVKRGFAEIDTDVPDSDVPSISGHQNRLGLIYLPASLSWFLPHTISPEMLSGSNRHPKSRTRGRSPKTKDRLRISPPPPTASSTIASPPLRMHSSPRCSSVLARAWCLLRGRRRALLSLIAVALLFLFLFSPSHDLLGLPPALQGLRRVSPASITSLMGHRVAEIHGLLYYVVNENEALAQDALDPSQSLDLSVYADGDPAPKPDWPARAKLLDAETPLIMFSKVRPSVFLNP
jgi:hypothetical protein